MSIGGGTKKKKIAKRRVWRSSRENLVLAPQKEEWVGRKRTLPEEKKSFVAEIRADYGGRGRRGGCGRGGGEGGTNP